ncbi:hypothetical protein K2173_008879 [Erythroxylum novogranatense]|uniref:Uncharacterized protein n=1 Tax=Erythroxylum novogranatense TaxID=1862640 RepID=A0AAV8S559_9ROSI|nr:hypothetical protein K2173_008879 [Erythroxylum novogranatense]
MLFSDLEGNLSIKTCARFLAIIGQVAHNEASTQEEAFPYVALARMYGRYKTIKTQEALIKEPKVLQGVLEAPIFNMQEFLIGIKVKNSMF